MKTFFSNVKEIVFGPGKTTNEMKKEFLKYVAETGDYLSGVDASGEKRASRIPGAELMGYLGHDCRVALAAGVTLNNEEIVRVTDLADKILSEFAPGKVIYPENIAALSGLGVPVEVLQHRHPKAFASVSMAPNLQLN